MWGGAPRVSLVLPPGAPAPRVLLGYLPTQSQTPRWGNPPGMWQGMTVVLVKLLCGVAHHGSPLSPLRCRATLTWWRGLASPRNIVEAISRRGVTRSPALAIDSLISSFFTCVLLVLGSLACFVWLLACLLGCFARVACLLDCMLDCCMLACLPACLLVLPACLLLCVHSCLFVCVAILAEETGLRRACLRCDGLAVYMATGFLAM